MRDHPETTPLRGRYLFRKPYARAAMAIFDAAGKVFNPLRNKPIAPPARILLCNIAHFGDVAIALALVPVLKRAFPDAEIGFLAGSWSRPLLELFPDVRWIHSFDHFLLNRQVPAFGKRIGLHARSSRQACREIRAVHYDVAIETYYFTKNAIPLLWRTGIPARIGYTSGGFGALLTHFLDSAYGDRHVLAYHLDLLKFLNVREALPSNLPWPPRRPSATPAPVMPQKDYIVIHPGGGAGFKAWPPDHWRSLVQALSTRGHCIVLTGRGAVERATIEAIIENMPGCLNLCDVLNWEQFIEILQNARLLIGIDSVAGHLAAAVDTPSVLIYTGTANLKNFGPLSEKCDLLIYPVPCSPCFLANGCEGMECVRWLTVDAVLEATLRALARPA